MILLIRWNNMIVMGNLKMVEAFFLNNFGEWESHINLGEKYGPSSFKTNLKSQRSCIE